LKQNIKRTDDGKEKCSLIFAALVQYIGKIGVESCLAAVKCTFPNIQRRTYDRTAFYCGIEFADSVIREEINVPDNKKAKPDNLRVLPPITEEEKEVVSWYGHFNFFLYI
jgi:hypothetical protein